MSLCFQSSCGKHIVVVRVRLAMDDLLGFNALSLCYMATSVLMFLLIIRLLAELPVCCAVWAILYCSILEDG